MTLIRDNIKCEFSESALTDKITKLLDYWHTELVSYWSNNVTPTENFIPFPTIAYITTEGNIRFTVYNLMNEMFCGHYEFVVNPVDFTYKYKKSGTFKNLTSVGESDDDTITTVNPTDEDTYKKILTDAIVAKALRDIFIPNPWGNQNYPISLMSKKTQDFLYDNVYTDDLNKYLI